jgi:hypothetical protein
MREMPGSVARAPPRFADAAITFLSATQTIPGFERIGQMAWYPDKRYAGLIARAQAQTRSRLQ